MNKKQKLIWDLPLRLFHWLFAIAILASWYTSEQEGELIDLHMQLGYFILGLVIFRILWGFLGSKHSRFAEFFPTPSRITQHLKAEQSPQYAGHNPLGSLMVFLMITLILLQAVSGLFINDDIFSSGPYYGQFGEEFGKVMSFIHHNAFDIMMFAIGLHILAMVYYRVQKKTDLVTPMITGKKSIESINPSDEIPNSKVWLAIIVGLLVALFIYWLVVLNVPVEEEYFY